ncbi:C-type lectin 37Da-like [Drosophila elegans]|uniref:C-type lectin 37Da-like n=1 Tax=Drosophila elegans TaxID=30023 RepID=UPI0007E6A573|nr:C-type lectin 37Da-like [Drosophila elegans]
MFLKLTGLCAFLGILSISFAHKITPNVFEGVPDILNITTVPFRKIGSSYYNIASKTVSWYTAFASCRQMRADLIAFESLEELNLISQYLIDENIVIKSYWTSGTNLAEQDNHVWFSNGQAVSSDLWISGGPINENKVEQCDELIIEPGRRVGLNDKKCSYLTSFICKVRQPKTASFLIL